MNVNAREYQMIGNAINDAAFAACLVSQPRKLTIRIIERIRADMQHHTRDVDADISVKIKMSGNDTAETPQQTDARRRHLELREKFGQSKPQRPVEINVESALRFTRLISGRDAGMSRLDLLRHHQALCFCNNARTRVSSRIFSASSRSARVCLAVTHARKQIRF